MTASARFAMAMPRADFFSRTCEKVMEGEFDCVVVDAPDEVRVARLMVYRGISQSEARQMINAQRLAVKKRAGADYLINHDGPLADLEAQVDDVWAELASNTHLNEN